MGIRWILATEVIPWARGTVRELDVARRLMHFAVREGQLPKNLDERLLTVTAADRPVPVGTQQPSQRRVPDVGSAETAVVGVASMHPSGSAMTPSWSHM